MTIPGICKGCGRNRLEREPHLVDCPTNRRVRDLRREVVAAAVRLNDVTNEFDRDMSILGEDLDALCCIVTRFKEAEIENGER